MSTERGPDGHECNAICLGGPCHGLLMHIDQDIGILVVPVPRHSREEAESCARYRITRERIRYRGRREPYVALHWADPPPPSCPCGDPVP
ncbi:hypothetical protein [Nonomuraea jiangxiensis]|uniref:Uncharacterized protein n=1 Tax=Nonomuraea jiangxiensis TaxID=633440 RepID=A0A1G8TUW3_9ACTN|nr:hypothetical protein [Nonomuraea jiangxiensis]SDJ45273.1 hypothetical protein SAMN05421869_110294 [Nonomuraea jiangxiensis]